MGGFFGGGGGMMPMPVFVPPPPAPPPPPPEPEPVGPSDEELRKARVQRGRQGGLQGTTITGGLGVSEEAETAKKTLLGG